VIQFGGTDYDLGFSIALDSAGYLYTIGVFAGPADFDPGPGTTTLVPAGDSDLFLCKYDTALNLVWAKQLGAPGGNVTPLGGGQTIVVDPFGDVCIAGAFWGTLDFDPGPDTFELTSAGNSDMYVAKYDASGNFLWAGRIGGTSIDGHYNEYEGEHFLAVDDAGNVYTTGSFRYTVDFDPGDGVYNLTCGSGNQPDICITKLNRSGNFVWAKSIGPGTFDRGAAIAVDSEGNSYMTGYFGGVADFDPGDGVYNLSAGSGNDAFVCKLDSAGNFVWAGNMGGSDPVIGTSIALDRAGNVIVTGLFLFGPADFDPGPDTFVLDPIDGYGDFVVKLDLSGDLMWAKQIGVPSEYAYGNLGAYVEVSESDDLYCVGRTRYYSKQKIFLAKLNRYGTELWSTPPHANAPLGGTQGWSMALDGAGTIYTIGALYGTVNVDPGDGTTTLTSAGSNDIYVMKLSEPVSVSSVAVAGADIVYNTVTFTVTFGEPVTGVDPSDFVLTTSGEIGGASVSTVGGSGLTYTVTVFLGTGTGSVRLDVIDDDTIVDSSSLPLGGTGLGNGDFTMGEVYEVDVTLPLRTWPVVVALTLIAVVASIRLVDRTRVIR
jgi:hypothetical protein